MSIDHGELNLPLSKRGNIDREIDAWKAGKRAGEKAARKEQAAGRAEFRADERERPKFTAAELAGAEMVAVADTVACRISYHSVTRVNATTVTIPGAFGPVRVPIARITSAYWADGRSIRKEGHS